MREPLEFGSDGCINNPEARTENSMLFPAGTGSKTHSAQNKPRINCLLHRTTLGSRWAMTMHDGRTNRYHLD
eukprot:scaffold442_cov110-Cylindrotheca_fusiformis.AAC.18